MQCCANEWRTLSARYVRTNEWRAISARYVRTNEWRTVSARHVVVNVTSRRVRSRGETRVDNGPRGRLSNTPSHLSLALIGDFRIRTLKVYVTYPSVVFGREVIGEVIGKFSVPFCQYRRN